MGSMSANCIQRNCGTAPPDRPDRIERSRPLPPEQIRPGAGRASFAATRSAALEVQTADGDTVSISFETARRLTASRGPEGGSVRAEASIAVQVEVSGSLSDQEVEDISNLLRDLVQTGAAPSAEGSSSVSSYTYAYQATLEASFARVRQAYA